MKTIALTGGGSAGHVIPHLALLPELKKYFNIVYIGSDGIERSLMKDTKVTFYTIHASKLVRGSVLKNLTLPYRLIQSVREAKKALDHCKADIIFSKGGYVALPVVLAAKSRKIPVFSHESDFSAGLANKIIAKRSNAVFTSFPETAKTLRNGIYSGSPIRQELLFANKSAALIKYGFSGNKPVLLSFGGGSGSAAIGSAIEGALPELLKHFDILHIRGKNGKAPKQPGYLPLEFEHDMASAYACADYVLARAGSNTVFELLALKKPSLLIPLENKRSRGDQAENAEYFQKRGLCRVLHEKDLSPSTLSRELIALEQDFNLRKNLALCSVSAGNDTIIAALLDASKNSDLHRIKNSPALKTS